MNKDDAELRKNLEESELAGMICIRISPIGPIVMGSPFDDVLGNREVVSAEGAQIIVEAIHQGLEAILKVVSNAPGAGAMVVLKDEAGMVDKVETRQDLDFFDKYNVLEDE
jgi:hypothetical protein